MFQGFHSQAIDFLYGLACNNERIWFQAHREEFERYLNGPMKALAQEVFQALTQRFPSQELLCKVTRIYRDARRHRGVSFYKESLWFTIGPPCPSMVSAPAFWFELTRNGWSYGMGFYSASPATMARHRALIDRAPGALLNLRRELLAQTEFQLEGESYARFKPGAPELLGGWYNLKSFSLIHQEAGCLALADGPALVERLVEGFSFLMPYYAYFYPLSDAAHLQD